MSGGKGRQVQQSETERRAINLREQTELANQIQLNEDQERRMRAMQRGGRKLLLFNSVLGVKEPQQQQQQTATMGVRS